MPLEIEKKFLVKTDGWREHSDSGTTIKQGYLHASVEKTVRIRIKGDQGFLTIKGKTTGFTRLEFEYEVPLADAKEMITLCEKPIIAKTRYLVTGPDQKTWELDVFTGDNAGLIIAEIELNSEDEAFDIPDWAGEDVTADPRYYNASLTKVPFQEW